MTSSRTSGARAEDRKDERERREDHGDQVGERRISDEREDGRESPKQAPERQRSDRPRAGANDPDRHRNQREKHREKREQRLVGPLTEGDACGVDHRYANAVLSSVRRAYARDRSHRPASAGGSSSRECPCSQRSACMAQASWTARPNGPTVAVERGRGGRSGPATRNGGNRGAAGGDDPVSRERQTATISETTRPGRARPKRPCASASPATP